MKAVGQSLRLFMAEDAWGKTFLIREMPRDSMAFCHAGLSVYEDGSAVSTEEPLRQFYHSLQLSPFNLSETEEHVGI